MLISWIQKTTLLDYPGKIATLIFTAGCNLRCQFCHNSEFVLPEKIEKIKDFIPEEIFFNFLQNKIWLIDGVVICGGEPTMQKDLVEFCEKIKNMWFLIKLDTNWFYPEKIQELIDKKLIDYIAMDIKWDLKNIDDLLGVKILPKNYITSINIIKNSQINYEFRTTLIKWYHSIENFKKMMNYIIWAKNYYIQNYRPWNTLNPNFHGKSFSSNELKEFEEIARKYVENCKIRL